MNGEHNIETEVRLFYIPNKLVCSVFDEPNLTDWFVAAEEATCARTYNF
jgi:hypothetical protein